LINRTPLIIMSTQMNLLHSYLITALKMIFMTLHHQRSCRTGLA